MIPNHKPDRLELSGGQRVLRLVAGVLLTVCAGLVGLGMTLWQGWLQSHRVAFAVYWAGCFLLVFAVLGLALWDLVLVRRAFKRRRRQLFREEFMTTEFVEKLRDAIRRDEERK